MALFDKPRVLEKLKRFYDYVGSNDGQIGTKQRGIDLNFNNACNLRCQHCFTNSPAGDHARAELPIDVVADIADQADELGIFEFDLQGGELLLRPDVLFEVHKAIRPERFYLYLTTNGYLLDEAMATRLAKAGVSRVSVSIDSMDENVHDEFRGRRESWKRAMEALGHVQNAGMHAYLNITVGHYNALSDDVEKLCRYSRERGYTTLLNVAVPSGMWHKMSEIMVDDRDRAHLMKLRKTHKNILRDIWNPFDRQYEKILGCNTVNRLYVTPLGDVLACPYVHIKIGNVYEQSLREISEFGFRVKYFKDHSELCLAGEDEEFASKYLQRDGQSIFTPCHAKDVFREADSI